MIRSYDKVKNECLKSGMHFYCIDVHRHFHHSFHFICICFSFLLWWASFSLFHSRSFNLAVFGFGGAWILTAQCVCAIFSITSLVVVVSLSFSFQAYTHTHSMEWWKPLSISMQYFFYGIQFKSLWANGERKRKQDPANWFLLLLVSPLTLIH